MPLLDIIRNACTRMEPLPTGCEPQRDPMPGIRAVLFDVYGTLFCSGTGDIGSTHASTETRAVADALSTLETLGQNTCTPETLKKHLSALIRKQHADRHSEGIAYPEVDIREIWRRLLQTTACFPDAAAVSDTEIERVALVYECAVNPVWPSPGCLPVIDALRMRGMRLGIISNAQYYTPLIFEALLGQSVEALGFSDSLCAWSYQLREAKPSPNMFSGIVRTLGQDNILPQEIVYVGNDMLNDVWAAAQAGCRTVLYAGDMRSLRLREDDARCASLAPDRVITALSQLDNILV